MVKLEKEARDSYAPRNCLSLFPNNVFPQKKKGSAGLIRNKRLPVSFSSNKREG